RLADIIGADTDGLHGWVHNPWTGLTLKLVVGLCGMALAVCRLMRNTRETEGEPLAPRDFVRRFCVLVVLVVTINFTSHFFRPWLPLFLQQERDFSESGMYGFNAAYYIAADVGSITAGVVSLLLVRRGLSVHRSRTRVFVACALGTSLSVAAAWARQDW